MTVRWYIAKHVPDLRRFEPRNVGVLVFAGDSAARRFLGETEDQRIDGRSVRWVREVEGYRAWVEAWRYWAENRSAERDAAMLRRRAGDQSFIQDAGERLYGEAGDPAALAESLYRELVEPSTATADDREDLARVKASDVWRRLTGRWARPELRELFRPKLIESPFNEEQFEYVFTNGRDHVVHRLSLDLAGPTTIRHTGTSWEGRLRALCPDSERLVIDVVLGMPALDAGERREAAEEAAAFLTKELERPGLATVVREADVPAYSRELEQAVVNHSEP